MIASGTSRGMAGRVREGREGGEEGGAIVSAAAVAAGRARQDAGTSFVEPLSSQGPCQATHAALVPAARSTRD